MEVVSEREDGKKEKPNIDRVTGCRRWLRRGRAKGGIVASLK